MPEVNLVPMMDVLMTILTFFIIISMTLSPQQRAAAADSVTAKPAAQSGATMISRRALLHACALPAWAGTALAEPLDDTLAHLQARWQPRLAFRPGADWRAPALATARQLMLRPGDPGSAWDTTVLAEQARGTGTGTGS